MRFLLDTHTFLWFITGNNKLVDYPKNLIEDINNNRFLSLASLWEIAIKISLDKLDINIPFNQLISDHIYGNDINLLPISPNHLNYIINMPFHHKDPFDRIIIAQAHCEDMAIISSDGQFRNYDTKVLWIE